MVALIFVAPYAEAVSWVPMEVNATTTHCCFDESRSGLQGVPQSESGLDSQGNLTSLVVAGPDPEDRKCQGQPRDPSLKIYLRGRLGHQAGRVAPTFQAGFNQARRPPADDVSHHHGGFKNAGRSQQGERRQGGELAGVRPGRAQITKDPALQREGEVTVWEPGKAR